MNKVLLFRWPESICNDLFGALNSLLQRELDARGIGHTYIDCRNPEDDHIITDTLEALKTGEFDAAVGFNVQGMHRLALPNGENAFDHYGVPFFNWIVDPPMDHYESMISTCKNYHVICIDKNHVGLIERFFPDIKSVHFLPLGGLDTDQVTQDLEDRDYDISFCAGFMKETPKEMLERIKAFSEPMRSLTMYMIDLMMTDRDMDTEDAFYTVLQEQGYDIKNISAERLRDLYRMCHGAHLFMRYYIRYEIVKKLTLSPVKFHLFGNGWREHLGMENRFSRTVFHPSVSFAETTEVFRNSRIVMNVMPWFKNGTHDRIASGMLHRAVVLSDTNKYLDEFPRGIIETYDLHNTDTLSQQIESMLGDMPKLQRIADAGYYYAKEHMSWNAITTELLNIIKETKANTI